MRGVGSGRQEVGGWFSPAYSPLGPPSRDRSRQPLPILCWCESFEFANKYARFCVSRLSAARRTGRLRTPLHYSDNTLSSRPTTDTGPSPVATLMAFDSSPPRRPLRRSLVNVFWCRRTGRDGFCARRKGPAG
uniref:Uncharacterized protein n=1 Tax=Plectus sambesii TaxID=2011161 RepID=A0A914X4I4_9BILA